MYRCDFLRHHHMQGPKIPQRVSFRYEDALQTNGDIPVLVLYNVSCHPLGAKKRFVKGEALRFLRTNSSNKTFEENVTTFKKHLMERGYPQNFINNTLSEVKFQERTQALLQRNKTKKTNLALRNTIPPSSVPNVKEILTRKWRLIQQQPLLNQIFKEPPTISHRKRCSLKDILVRAKL